MTDVAELIGAVLQIDPPGNAIEWQGRWLSRGELMQRIAELDALYRQLDLPSGARIGILLRNRLPQLIALYSVLLGTRCVVTINPHYPDATVATDIAALNLPLLIGEPDDLARAGVTEAMTTGGGGIVALPPAWAQAPRIIRLPTPGSARPVADGVMIEMLTSGTTGKPKRAALTRDAFQRSFDAALRYEAGRDGAITPRLRSGTQVLVAPLTHIGGMWGAINTLAAGRKLVLLEKFRVDAWRQAVVAHRPVVASVTGAALRMILDADIPADELASLRVMTVGAAPVEADVVDAFHARFGVPVLTNYGATEFAGPVAGWSLEDFRAHWGERRGSCGRVHAGIDARVVDPESGATLPVMTDGVLELRGAQLGDADRWVRTTDLARLSDDRFLWIAGRADAAIIRGGFKVHPAEVVAVLERHPAVREAVVVGMADGRLGTVPVAAVIPRTGLAAPVAGELDRFARQRLLPYQCPVFYAVLDDVPRTASMKPVLPEVAALLARLWGTASSH